MISVSSQHLESNTSLHPLLQWHILSLLERMDKKQQNLAILRQLWNHTNSFRYSGREWRIGSQKSHQVLIPQHPVGRSPVSSQWNTRAQRYSVEQRFAEWDHCYSSSLVWWHSLSLHKRATRRRSDCAPWGKGTCFIDPWPLKFFAMESGSRLASNFTQFCLILLKYKWWFIPRYL